MNEEDALVAAAVQLVLDDVARAVDETRGEAREGRKAVLYRHRHFRTIGCA